MKRLFSTGLILLLIFIFSACSGQVAQSTTSSTPMPTNLSSTDDEGEDEIIKVKIGFSFSGEGAFRDQVLLDIEKTCASMNYDPQIMTAVSSDQQQKDIETMLAKGVVAIVIDPVDVDSLESVLAACETQEVPVINIIDSINGRVSMLISPNYNSIGESAGQYALDLFGEQGGGCMMLKTDYDSFEMQLMTDGFNSAIDKDKDVSLVDEQFCGNDEDKAYELTKASILENENIQFIFAQSAVLARGAIRAIDEAGKDMKLVVYGGDMDIIEVVASGDIYASIFFGPKKLAEETVKYVDRFVKDAAYQPPQYVEMNIEVATFDNASKYKQDGALHAETIGQ